MKTLLCKIVISVNSAKGETTVSNLLADVGISQIRPDLFDFLELLARICCRNTWRNDHVLAHVPIDGGRDTCMNCQSFADQSNKGC